MTRTPTRTLARVRGTDASLRLLRTTTTRDLRHRGPTVPMETGRLSTFRRRESLVSTSRISLHLFKSTNLRGALGSEDDRASDEEHEPDAEDPLNSPSPVANKRRTAAVKGPQAGETLPSHPIVAKLARRSTTRASSTSSSTSRSHSRTSSIAALDPSAPNTPAKSSAVSTKTRSPRTPLKRGGSGRATLSQFTPHTRSILKAAKADFRIELATKCPFPEGTEGTDMGLAVFLRVAKAQNCTKDAEKIRSNKVFRGDTITIVRRTLSSLCHNANQVLFSFDRLSQLSALSFEP